MKISLIEDEPDCHESYKALLEERGHKVILYSEADEVVSNLNIICETNVIILDLMIQLGTKINPKEATETGIAIYKRIRKISLDIPIVILTAKLYSDVWDDFKNDNLVKYLGKPVSDLDKFYKTIEDWG